ncbi:MAG: HAD family hydrolase [archaeon]
MRKLILFDFDGVLVKSNHCHVRNIRNAFSNADVPLNASDEEITHHFGKHYKVIVPKLLEEDYRTPEIERRIGEKVKEGFEDDRFSDCFEEIEGISEFLLDLKKRNHVLAIASGNSHHVLEKWVSRLGLLKYFSLLIGADDVENGKPFPDMILLASRHFNIPAEKIVYVGDTKNDVLMAKNAGCECAVVLTGVLKRKDAEELGVDMIAEDVTKLDL